MKSSHYLHLNLQQQFYCCSRRTPGLVSVAVVCRSPAPGRGQPARRPGRAVGAGPLYIHAWFLCYSGQTQSATSHPRRRRSRLSIVGIVTGPATVTVAHWHAGGHGARATPGPGSGRLRLRLVDCVLHRTQARRWLESSSTVNVGPNSAPVSDLDDFKSVASQRFVFWTFWCKFKVRTPRGYIIVTPVDML